MRRDERVEPRAALRRQVRERAGRSAANEREQQDRDADDDERVGEVERRPGLEVEEVGDAAEPDAVDEVRDAAADHEPERNRQHRVARARAREEEQHPADGERGEDDDDRRRAREEAERDARVLHVVDRERPEHLHLVVERELRRDDVLRQLVGGDRGDGDRAEREPLGRAGRERALDRRERRERVGRGSDADVDRARVVDSVTALASRWQSMQSVAHGIASSRSSAIGFPQFAQVPYVPSSIRASAASICSSTCSECSSSV